MKAFVASLGFVVFVFLGQDVWGQKQKYSFFLGGGSVELFHIGGAYQIYPSGRLSASIGIVRNFNQWIIFPWYGRYSKVHFTTFSLNHQYFFKTSSRQVTPFYLRTGFTYREDNHYYFNAITQNFEAGSAKTFLIASLAPGIAIDFKRHWGFSFDAGLGVFWREEPYTSDVDDERLPISFILRLQAYYWR